MPNPVDKNSRCKRILRIAQPVSQLAPTALGMVPRNQLPSENRKEPTGHLVGSFARLASQLDPRIGGLGVTDPISHPIEDLGCDGRPLSLELLVLLIETGKELLARRAP